MIRTVRVTNVARAAARLAKAQQTDRRAAEAILDDVRQNGDAAVRKYERRFGAPHTSLRVSESEIAEALESISGSQRRAVEMARDRLAKSESAIKSALHIKPVSIHGAKISRQFLPIGSVGCYAPGGLARYPSSMIMSVVPARVAGVQRIAVASPPGPDGKADQLTVSAASICGATEIYKMGGAQAIAALAFGTRSIPKVDKIVGPGGPIVTAAKSTASRHTAIDMIAGPTELGIIADRTANPRYIALDLISQAEHGPDTQCYLLTNSDDLARKVKGELAKIVRGIKRQEIVRASLRSNGFAAVCRSLQEAACLADMLAPEHLQIMTRDPDKIASIVSAPGLVLVGSYSPSAASDYLLGSNHILPTNGSGRTRGPLSVLDFVKLGTKVTASAAALQAISKPLGELTEAEGLSNHYEAVMGRMQ